MMLFQVKLIRLVGMMLIVFARQGLKVKHVMASQLGTGLMGVMVSHQDKLAH